MARRIGFAAHIGYDSAELTDGVVKYVPIFEEACRALGYEGKVYVTVLTDLMLRYVEAILPNSTVIKVPNIGADFLPFIRVLQMIEDHKYVFKIHTKSNVQWREAITVPLMKSAGRAKKIIELMDNNPLIGSVIARNMALRAEEYCTRSRLRDLLLEQRWAPTIEAADALIDQSVFSGGAVYWARVATFTKAFGSLEIEAEYKLNDVGYAPGGDETRLHHWERMAGIAPVRFGQMVALVP